MNKRTLAFLAALILLVPLFPAFSESEGGVDSLEIAVLTVSPTDIQEVPSFDEEIITLDDEFSVTYGNVQVHLGDDPERIVEEIQKIEGAENAIEISDDRSTFYTPAYKCYETDNIAVMTNTGEDDSEEVKAIFIDIDGVKTHRGISVGSPMKDVYERYGSDYMSFSDTILYTIKKPGKDTHYLLFQVDDTTDTVFSYAILDEIPGVFSNKKK